MWQLADAGHCSSHCLIDADAVAFAFVVAAIDFHSRACCSPSRCSSRCARIRVFVGCSAVCSAGFAAVVRLTVDVHLMLKYCVAMDGD